MRGHDHVFGAWFHLGARRPRQIGHGRNPFTEELQVRARPGIPTSIPLTGTLVPEAGGGRFHPHVPVRVTPDIGTWPYSPSKNLPLEDERGSPDGTGRT